MECTQLWFLRMKGNLLWFSRDGLVSYYTICYAAWNTCCYMVNVVWNNQWCAIPIPELELESEFRGFLGPMESESDLNWRLKSHGGTGIGIELKAKSQDGIGIGMELNPYGIGIGQFQPFLDSEVKTLHQRQARKALGRAQPSLGKGQMVECLFTHFLTLEYLAI